jgi:serine/threonine-protein kinase
VPTGLLSVNAVPWASVSVDGGEVGTTPLANVALPIGSHEVVWRHPQLGERRRTIAITARTPTRIGMDFKQ